jgi:hypothetical protein
MCTAAPIMKKIMKTTCAGMSICFTGAPPRGHTIGGYGGPWATCKLLVAKVYMELSRSNLDGLTIEGGMPPCEAILTNVRIIWPANVFSP